MTVYGKRFLTICALAIYPGRTCKNVCHIKNGRRSVFSKHLDVARVDFCSFANSSPFRIRIVNKFNDNYDHYYIKQADASRIYGLELEHLLSPNRIIFLLISKH